MTNTRLAIISIFTLLLILPTVLALYSSFVITNDFDKNGYYRNSSAEIWDQYYFKIDGNDYTVRVDNITNDTTTLTVNNKQLVFLVDNKKEIDVNNDNTNDLRITLITINVDKADLLFEKLAPPPASTTTQPEPPTGIQENTISKLPSEQQPPDSSLVMIAGTIVLVGSIVYYIMEGRHHLRIAYA